MTENYEPAVWYPAHENNFSKGRQVYYVLIHIAEGGFESIGGTFAYENLDEPGHGGPRSAHYGISPTGKIHQYVDEGDVAWHAGNWKWNCLSVGIEHSGYHNDPETWTEAMLDASARLTADLVFRYELKPNRKFIKGHYEAPKPNDHTGCPGPYFPWDKYIEMVDGYYRELKRADKEEE